MTDALKEVAVDFFKPVITQTCLKVTYQKPNGCWHGLDCVWHLPCSLYLPQCWSFFDVVFIKSHLGLLF